jgi:hypothetical protein
MSVSERWTPSVPVAGVRVTTTNTFSRRGMDVSDHELSPSPAGRTGITAPLAGDTLVIGSGVGWPMKACAVAVVPAIAANAMQTATLTFLPPAATA